MSKGGVVGNTRRAYYEAWGKKEKELKNPSEIAHKSGWGKLLPHVFRLAPLQNEIAPKSYDLGDKLKGPKLPQN